LRTRWLLLALGVLLVGVLAGSMLAPQPADAVSREMIQLQQQVSQIQQGQQDLRSAMDQKNAELKTLLEQTLDSTNKMSLSMGSLQKTVQDVQANSGARIDTLATQVQGLSDNLQDIQARVGKLSQQVTDAQGVLQSIDAKVSGGAASAPPSAPGPGQPVASGPPISSDVLYTNALRDFTGGKYDLARQEFGDYLKNFPTSDLASNAQFYLGEIDFVQGEYKGAIGEYDRVLTNYPKSYKLAAARLKKGEAELSLGQKANALRDFREVVRRYPGTDEARRAQAKLREMGAASPPRSPSE
jgi:tol-pal system protein YbgF